MLMDVWGIQAIALSQEQTDDFEVVLAHRLDTKHGLTNRGLCLTNGVCTMSKTRMMVMGWKRETSWTICQTPFVVIAELTG